jgi:NAD(P)-dependent dehydrogenase (short-subunit alcohol dehydrogenase family)
MTTRTAIITGGSRGLGRSTAEALARAGVDVIVTYQHRADEAQAFVAAAQAQGRQAAALQLDVGDAASFAAFADAVRGVLAGWGRERFDYLVNNAGHGLHKPMLETTEAEFDAIVAAHFKGPYFLTQRLAPLLADGGRIVNVSSGLTRFAFPGLSAYAAAKGALEVLTRYQAVELGARGIAVNTVAPGAIATDFGGGRVRDDAGYNQAVASQTALGRVGEPEDVGPMIAGLLDEAYRWVNAQRIEVSGGMRI